MGWRSKHTEDPTTKRTKLIRHSFVKYAIDPFSHLLSIESKMAKKNAAERTFFCWSSQRHECIPIGSHSPWFVSVQNNNSITEKNPINWHFHFKKNFAWHHQKMLPSKQHIVSFSTQTQRPSIVNKLAWPLQTPSSKKYKVCCDQIRPCSVIFFTADLWFIMSFLVSRSRRLELNFISYNPKTTLLKRWKEEGNYVLVFKLWLGV